MFNNNTVEITSYGILSDKVKNGIVVAHLSDLHEKEFGPENAQLFEKVEALAPDLIACLLYTSKDIRGGSRIA